MSRLLKSRTYFSPDVSLCPLVQGMKHAYQVILTFHGRLITHFLFRVHVCLSEHSDLSFVYRFMSSLEYVDHVLLQVREMMLKLNNAAIALC